MIESSVSAPERQQHLLRWIEQQQRVTVPEITQHFAISPATARRDLETLAEQGKVQRVHGGALAVPRSPPEAPVIQRSAEQADPKRRIGDAAAVLVNDGDTVFLGSGTSVLEVARHLHERRNLTVITNSLLVVNELASNPAINIIVLGGSVRHSELSLIGHLADQMLQEVRSVKVIMGIRAIDIEEGLTNAYFEEAMIDRAILRRASEAIIVADNSKCGRVSTAFVAALSAIDTLVTDTSTPSEFVDALRAQEIKVIVA